MCVISRGYVIKCEKDSRDHLRQEKKEQPRSKYVREPGATWNRLIECRVQKSIETSSEIEPAKNLAVSLRCECALTLGAGFRLLGFHVLLRVLADHFFEWN